MLNVRVKPFSHTSPVRPEMRFQQVADELGVSRSNPSLVECDDRKARKMIITIERNGPVSLIAACLH